MTTGIIIGIIILILFALAGKKKLMLTYKKQKSAQESKKRRNLGRLDWFKKNQESANFKTPEEYYAWKEKWLENKHSEEEERGSHLD